MLLSNIVLIILLLIVVGALPAWRHSRGWGYYPSSGLGSILVRHFLGTCRKKGIKYVDLNAKKNTVGFYRNFGFKSEGKYAVLYRRLRPN